MKQFVEYLWGWDATAPEVIDDAKWQETFDVYVQDKHKLDMAKFFDEKSPFAYQDITARMTETVRKGYWKADEATKKKLLEEYVESVNRHGVGCAENTCGNPRLQKYVLDEGRRVGIPVPALEGFQKAMEAATGTKIEQAADELSSFARKNDAEMAANLSKMPDMARVARQLKGYLMEATQSAQRPTAERPAPTPGQAWQPVLAGGPVLVVLLAWRYRRRGRR
jgi:cobaltochelatase CobN